MRRPGEPPTWHQPITRAALATGRVVPDDAKVIDRDVGELRAARAFADGPDIGRGRFQPLVHANVSAIVELDAGLLETDAGGVRDATCCNEYVAGLDCPFAGGPTHCHGHFLSTPSVDLEHLGGRQELDAFIAQEALHGIRGVGVLAADDPRSWLDDSDAAAESAIRLGHFDAYISPADHHQLPAALANL